jgi:putative ABC transport system permease protein
MFLLMAVAVVLLIACANLANLLLSRSAQRQREMAVRAALGAGRSRTVRQLVAETMIIAVFGGVAGVALAYWTLPALLRLAPSSFDLGSVAVLDSRVLLFSLGLVLLTGVLFGAAPAFQSSHINVTAALASGTRGSVQGGTRETVRAAFVVFQVAMSVVLLTGAVLLLRSFQALLATETGMNTRNVLSMEYRLPRNKYTNADAQAAFHREIAARVSKVPGVVSSAVVRALPFSGNFGQAQFVILDRPAPEKGKEPVAYTNAATPNYFATAGIPVLRGRIFDDHDSPETQMVAVISRAIAERYFSGEDPVGRSLQFVDNNPAIDGKRVTVVGVVGNTKQMSLRDTDEAEIYTCYGQDPGIFGTLVVRTAVDPMSLADAVRQAVWSLDKDQPVWKVRTLAFLVERDVASDRFLMVLMLGFGVLALALTALGTYGVLSNAVNQRQQEIGVRMALGAQPGALRGLVLTRGIKLALVGGLIGVAAAAAGTRLVSSLLYGISPLDPAAFITGFAAILLVAFAASYLPAHRATRVDPIRALRCD